MSAPVSAAEEYEERGPRPGESLRADLLGPLRAWQKEAYREYFAQPRRDFLVVATPGAGKTAYALTVAAEGRKSDKAKPFKGVEGGLFEIARRHRGDAYRVVYAVKIGQGRPCKALGRIRESFGR